MEPGTSLSAYLAAALIPGTPAFYSLVIAAVFCLCLALFVWWRVFYGKRRHFVPFGKVVEQPIIRMMLQDAFDQRRPFEVQIATESTSRRPILRCSPEYLGATGITLEVNGLKTLSEAWINRSVEVYFRISRGRGDFAHFMFSSSIQSIYAPKKNICLITLPIPEELDNRQKRSFLRISPPEKYLFGAAFWYGDNMPAPEKLTDISLWPNPLLFIIKDEIAQFSIIDLSAGGVRLSFPHNVLQLYDIHLSAVDHFILMMDLMDPEAGKLLRVWLHCRTQSVMVDTDDREVVIGAQFLSWGKPREESGGSGSTVEWLRIPSSREVEAVGNWIMRRHMEMFREHPGIDEKPF